MTRITRNLIQEAFKTCSGEESLPLAEASSMDQYHELVDAFFEETLPTLVKDLTKRIRRSDYNTESAATQVSLMKLFASRIADAVAKIERASK